MTWEIKDPLSNNDPKTYIPESLRQDLLEWFHENLCHPGQDRMTATIRKNYAWPGMTKDTQNLVKNCGRCQKGKVTGVKNYVHNALS